MPLKHEKATAIANACYTTLHPRHGTSRPFFAGLFLSLLSVFPITACLLTAGLDTKRRGWEEGGVMWTEVGQDEEEEVQKGV